MMRDKSYRLPDCLLIVPNIEHFFGEVRNRENPLDVMRTFSFKDIADIYLTRSGAIGFRFLDHGPLESILRLRETRPGMAADHLVNNHDEVVELQGRRLVFSNFISATLFGRLSALRHSALSGAQYAGMDEIVAFAPSATALRVEDSQHSTAAFSPKFRLVNEEPSRVQIVTAEEIGEAVAFVAHIAEREDELEYADLQACIVMNYQAAILHNEQHAAASLALNFAVAETLIHEIFLSYGIVGDRSSKPFATRAHNVPKVSNTQFSKWRMEKRIEALSKGGLMDFHLCQRLNDARTLRNELMHSAAGVSIRDAGSMQTAVRDLWSYLLGAPFELLTGWSMRI